MRNNGCYRWSGLGMLMLFGACGCVSHMFGSPGSAPPDGGFAAQWQAGGPRPGGKLAGPSPAAAGLQPPTPAPASGDQIALMSNRLQATEDDRKVLAARLQQMELQLHEKEKILVLSNYEVQEAARQVSQTRAELKRWKEEMESLRTQLRASEKENKGTLEAIIRTLEQFMEREKETTAAPK